MRALRFFSLILQLLLGSLESHIGKFKEDQAKNRFRYFIKF